MFLSTPTIALALMVPLGPQVDPPPAAAAPTRPEDLPWPARLGYRAALLELGLPVVRQVVLVPDAATWLDEVGRWTPTARWPVLIEEDQFAPMFVRAFKPERVIRRASVGALPPTKEEREQAMQSVVGKAWGGDGAGSADAALKKAGIIPPAIVVTSADDPAWTAGVALAAGRGLPIRFLDGDFGSPNETLDAVKFAALDDGVRSAIVSTGLPFETLGDAIDAVALCRTIAAKAKPALSEAATMKLPPNPDVKPGDPLATTDALARHDDGSRYGVVGWIPGPSDRAAYMAMSSLFLDRDEFWFVSGYANGEPWSRYAPQPAADALKARGFTTKVWTGEQANLTNWLRLLMGGINPDVLVMNSSGNPDSFSLAGNDHGRTVDVPFLTKPLALHLIHSWSLTRPTDDATIGGRFLNRGAYAYYGSVQEPFLTAFVPPAALANRWLGLGPFLVSARLLDGSADLPWRLTAIGDPLLLVIPPQQRAQARPEGRTADEPPVNGEDVRGLATAAMKTVAASASDPSAAQKAMGAALRDLVVLGEDGLAAKLWQAAPPAVRTAETAPLVLGPLFRERSFNEYMKAFAMVKEPSPEAIDMLWHLATPRIEALDQDRLMTLRRWVRGPDPSIDLARLLPGVDKAMGRGASDRIVNDELDKSVNPGVQRRLSDLLRR